MICSPKTHHRPDPTKKSGSTTVKKSTKAECCESESVNVVIDNVNLSIEAVVNKKERDEVK